MAYNKAIFEMYWYTENDWSKYKNVALAKIIGHVPWSRSNKGMSVSSTSKVRNT